MHQKQIKVYSDAEGTILTKIWIVRKIPVHLVYKFIKNEA
jgi:hypothetical protein